MENTTQVLSEIAQQLQVSVSHLWDALVAQQPINSTITIIQICACLCISIISYLVYRRNLNKIIEGLGDRFYRPDILDKYSLSIPFVTSIAFGLVFVICSIASMQDIITGYTNPEYSALMDLLNATSKSN